MPVPIRKNLTSVTPKARFPSFWGDRAHACSLKTGIPMLRCSEWSFVTSNRKILISRDPRKETSLADSLENNHLPSWMNVNLNTSNPTRTRFSLRLISELHLGEAGRPLSRRASHTQAGCNSLKPLSKQVLYHKENSVAKLTSVKHYPTLFASLKNLTTHKVSVSLVKSTKAILRGKKMRKSAKYSRMRTSKKQMISMNWSRQKA